MANWVTLKLLLSTNAHPAWLNIGADRVRYHERTRSFVRIGKLCPRLQRNDGSASVLKNVERDACMLAVIL